MAAGRLFVYGTLCDPEHVRALVGRELPRRPARLDGFARHLGGLGYAYVVPAAGNAVDGFVLDDVDAAALRALDEYEGEGRLYTRATVVATVDGVDTPCEAYVGVPEAHGTGAAVSRGASARARRRRRASDA